MGAPVPSAEHDRDTPAHGGAAAAQGTVCATPDRDEHCGRWCAIARPGPSRTQAHACHILKHDNTPVTSARLVTKYCLRQCDRLSGECGQYFRLLLTCVHMVALIAAGSGSGTCPAGTTSSYADEGLAFRFRAADITRDSAGSLVWGAAAPYGMAFVMNRTIVPNTHEFMEMAKDPWGWFAPPVVEPAVVARNMSKVPGLLFTPKAGAAMVMYANRTVAIGANHTFFAVLTPSPGIIRLAETIIGFRPGVGGKGGKGCFAWYAGYIGSGGSSQRVLSADTFSSCGFAGPAVHPDVLQVLIARSHYGVNAKSVNGPVVELSVVDISPNSTSFRGQDRAKVSWAGRMYGDGLKEYTVEQSRNKERRTEKFELDYRDGPTDGDHVLAAGYMALGNMLPAMGNLFQYRGTVHHLELHYRTLTDEHVADVVQKLRHTLVPSAAAFPACSDCAAGMHDGDRDAATMCRPCGRGTFSSKAKSTNCMGTCSVGSTILSTGATSRAACSRCTEGQFGAIVHGRAVCKQCEPGRASTAIGATTGSTCANCAAGKFSAPGGTACERSGCTDEWADNFSPSAIVDEGTCKYSCSRIYELASASGLNSGGCVMHDPRRSWGAAGNASDFPQGRWLRYLLPAAEFSVTPSMAIVVVPT